MAASEYPYLYRYTHGEAVRRGEENLWEPSFRENVRCARAIESAIRNGFDNELHIGSGCAALVLEEYGFKRVNYVLAHTICVEAKNVIISHLYPDEVKEWAKASGIVPDATYGRYYEVDTAAGLLCEFVGQVREANQALGLFGYEHCSAGMYEENTEGKVLILSPETLKESAWSPQNQLWLATGGFGCDPKASGRVIYATYLGDGEETRWNREDFVGVLDEQYLPEWAAEKLEALRAPKQEQTAAPTMGGMEMG